MTRYLIISSFMNFAGALLLAFAVVLRSRKNRLNQQFGLFVFCVGAWSAGYFMWQISEEAGRALFFSRVLMLPAYFIPVTYLHFITQLCGERRPWWIRTGYAAAVVFVALDFTPWMVSEVKPAMEFPLWPRAGPGFIFYIALFGVFTVQAIVLMLQQLRQSSGARAEQLRYILTATLVGFPGGATNFPLWYDVTVPPVGNALIFIYLVIMAHAVSRYQLPLVTYDLVHAAVYMAMSVTLAIFYVLVRLVVASLQGVALSSGDQLNAFLTGMVVSLLFFWAVPRLKQRADRILEQTYLRKRAGQRSRLKELAQQICAISAEQEIFDITAREISGAMGITHLGLFIRGEFSDVYELRAHAGWWHGGFALKSFPAGPGLVRALTQRQAPLLFDDSEVELPAAEAESLEEMRKAMPYEAAFPILTEGFLLGVLVLGARGNRDRYTEQDISLLEAICLQIGVTLRARQLERRASQTEKLISLGTLAAGLAHELRNPLVSIQTFTALLPERGADSDFRHEFGGIVQRDVSRIASIIANVAAFAENNKVEMTIVELADVLRAVADILGPELQRTAVELSLPAEALPKVRGNYSQLLQVFLNLIQNALQAFEGRPGGRVTIGAWVRAQDLPGPLLCVSVIDNGPGIDPVLLPRIFDPFITTKSTGDRRGNQGMGLGLAIVKRIVQHHQGDIEVSSTPGLGTVFRVLLPCAE